MKDFIFKNNTKIIFGKESHLCLSEEIRKYGKRVLLHYGSKSIKENGIYDLTIRQLKAAGAEITELPGVMPNPRLKLIYEGIDICRKNKIDLILAVGGGSVIDSAKAIGIGACSEYDLWDMVTKNISADKTIPVGVVLTIPAAGSESSDSFVITNEEGWYKRSLNSDLMRPVFAILNPEFTYSLPPYQTACGIADIMAHIMERYFTKEKNVEITDRMCEAVLKTVINNSEKVLDNPYDYNARAELMWAGAIAHNDLLGTGRIGDWASHNIEHELSGIYDVPHGAGLAVVFPAWMKYVYIDYVEKFSQFSVRVWSNEHDFDNPEKTALKGISCLEEFFKGIGLPTTLKEINIGRDRLAEMACKCTEKGTVGNLKKLNETDVLKIYNLASG